MATLNQQLDPIYVGADLDLVITDNSTIDLTTATEIRFAVVGLAGRLFEKTLGAGEITADSANQATITIDAADTSGAFPAQHEWQLWVTNASSKEEMVAAGKVDIRERYVSSA